MWFNLISFNVLWFGLVLIGSPFIIVAALWLCCHLLLVNNKKAELATVSSIACLGVLIDSALTYLGIFSFTDATLLPYWLITLWLCFAATIGHSLKFLAKSKILQLLVGGLLAPLSYLAAQGFNAVSFSYSLPAMYLILALIWAPLMVLCFTLQRYFYSVFSDASADKIHQHFSFISALFLTAFTFTSPVFMHTSSAQTPNETLKPTVEQLPIKQFKRIGSAMFSVLFWDIYQSTLFTSTGTYPVANNEKLLFKIDYLKDISADDLIMRTVEQWQHLGVKEGDYQVYLPQLSKLWPNIKAGDNLALLIADRQSHFYFNEGYIGTIESADFGQLFIDIWLSSNTSQPKLRQQLLAGNTLQGNKNEK